MLLSVAITAVLAILIYLIYVCGMREKTYEEMMEEQRKQRLQLETQVVSKKGEKKEKVKKKKKKAVAADVVVTSDEGEHEIEVQEEIAEEVPELVAVPEPVVEQVKQAPPPTKLTKRKKHARSEEKQEVVYQEIKQTEVIKEEVSIVKSEVVMTTAAPV